MTVSELIEILKTLPPDAPVVAEGYEDGYDTIKKVKQIKVAEVENKEWYIGLYEESNAPDAIDVVYLAAENKSDNKYEGK